MRLALALVLLSGCQWARVRYVDGAAQRAERVTCERPGPKTNEAVDFVCREEVPHVPANNQTRIDM